MTHDEFELLVKRLESAAAADPRGYRRKLGALAILGYAYIAGVLALLLVATGAIVWLATLSAAALLLVKQVGWAFLVLACMVLRAMWIRFEEPEGRLLERIDFPELFEAIEDLRACARAPALDAVLLTNDFNAAVVQHPRFGLLGGVRNYLVLGLPLMHALAPEEFKAVIAHEFGHLSGSHGRFGAWIYRLRAGWTRLLAALQEDRHWGTRLFTRFFNWYAPVFSAYSFVQARQQEYEADRMSVKAVGASAAASALLRVNVQDDFLGEKFWPAILKRAETDPLPTMSPFAMLGRALKQGGPPSAVQQWLGKSLQQRTGYDDTHPCLVDRLRAIGVEPYLPARISRNAADVLLGRGALAVQREMDEKWRLGIKAWWNERHQYATTARTRLAELERKSMIGSLTDDDLWNRARYTEEFGSADAALEIYSKLIARNAQHVGALFHRGQLLLSRDESRGIDDLSVAIQIDGSLEQPACELVARFFRRIGQDAQARPYQLRYWELEERAELARRERSTARLNDTFAPHALGPSDLAVLCEELSRVGGVRRAYLVRKQVSIDPQIPLYVLGVVSDVPWWYLATQRSEGELIRRIGEQCRLPGETLILSLRTNRDLEKPLRKVSGSGIFQRLPSASAILR
jgi:Zn-dependent protease with chaperone function